MYMLQLLLISFNIKNAFLYKLLLVVPISKQVTPEGSHEPVGQR